MTRLRMFITAAALAVTLLVPSSVLAQDPRGGGGENRPGGAGGNVGGGMSHGGSLGSSPGVSSGGGTFTGGSSGGSMGGGGGWSPGPGVGGSRRIDPGGTGMPSGRRYGTSGAPGEVPWYTRSRGDRPVSGTPAGREEVGGRPRPPSWNGGFNPDWWYSYWGYGAGLYSMSYYLPSCGQGYGMGGFGLGYFYFDPSWWTYWPGGSPCSGYFGSGLAAGTGYAGGYGTGGGRSTRGMAESGLKLKVTPSNAQVFVDGYFAGEVDEFDGTFQRLPLSAGTHRIEVRADGYEPLVFEVSVEAYQTVTRKADLKKRQ